MELFMRGALLLALFLTAVIPLNGAFADGRAFPPDNCSGANPFMAFNGVTSGGNTYCIDGQTVLNNALSTCDTDQVIAFNGSAFYCKTIELDAPPACGPGEFLTSNGSSFSCASTNVPTCAANYVLTYNGSAFVCVPKNASIPTCAANQFLTYNGSSFQCAATQNLTIPTCGAGETLTGNGSTLTCAPSLSGAFTSDLIFSNISSDWSASGSYKTYPLSSGRKFSDYSALLVTFRPAAGGYRGSILIPMSDFINSGGDMFAPLTYWGGEGVSSATVLFNYVNDTSFRVHGGQVTLRGVK
jgi:hypothetical protein